MAIKGKEELKKLNTLQVKLQSEIEAIKIEREILNNKLQSAERNLGKIREEIKIKGREYINRFRTCNAALHRKSLGN